LEKKSMGSQMQNVGRMDLKQCFFGGLFGGEVGGFQFQPANVRLSRPLKDLTVYNVQYVAKCWRTRTPVPPIHCGFRPDSYWVLSQLPLCSPAKRLMRRRRRKERRFATDVNHQISKKIVGAAKRTGCGIPVKQKPAIRPPAKALGERVNANPF
jgi:hypothetical protein